MSAIFQLYQGKNKQHFNDDDGNVVVLIIDDDNSNGDDEMMYALYQLDQHA